MLVHQSPIQRRPIADASFLLVMALGLRAEPITQRVIFRVEEIVGDGEDRSPSADLKAVPSPLYDL